MTIEKMNFYNSLDNNKDEKVKKALSSIEVKKEISEIDKKMLVILNELDDLFAKEGIKNFVVGGWAIEGHGGPKTKREHHDIDYLIFQKDRSKIEEILSKENYEIVKQEYGKDGQLHDFKHKLAGKKDGIEIDFGFIDINEENKEVYIPAFPEFHFPIEFLSGGKSSLKSENGCLSKFNVVSKELLLALKAKSERIEDQRDVEFLKKEIKNEQKIEEITEKYALDYSQFEKKMQKDANKTDAN